MPSSYQPASGRELKRALTTAMRKVAHEFLVEQRGQDLPDDLLAIGDYAFEVQTLDKNQFVIRAKALDEQGEPMNRPALQFEVTITGGG